jgi:hypothetical protein
LIWRLITEAPPSRFPSALYVRLVISNQELEHGSFSEDMSVRKKLVAASPVVIASTAIRAAFSGVAQITRVVFLDLLRQVLVNGHEVVGLSPRIGKAPKMTTSMN